MNKPMDPSKVWMSTARLEFRLRTFWRGYRVSQKVTDELMASLYEHCLAESIPLRHRSQLIKRMVEHLSERRRTIGVDYINPAHPLRINTIKSREFNERYHAFTTIAAFVALAMVAIGLGLAFGPYKPNIGRVVAMVGMMVSTTAAFIGWKGDQLQGQSIDGQHEEENL